MNILDRLNKVIQQTGLSPSAFANKIGYNQSNLSKILSSKRDMNANLIKSICIAYPQLNKTWLLTGEGEMFKPTQSIGDITNSTVSGVNVSGTDIHINPDAYNTLLKIVENNQRATEKFQEQIDRLIAIIESRYGTENR